MKELTLASRILEMQEKQNQDLIRKQEKL